MHRSSEFRPFSRTLLWSTSAYIAENLDLGQELTKFGVLMDRKRMIEGAARANYNLGVNLPHRPSQGWRHLRWPTSGSRGRGAVLQGGLITLLDEPTAALGVREGQKVLDIVVKLREAGHAILLISHNLDTVFEISDRIAVMRLGENSATFARATLREGIVAMIVVPPPESMRRPKGTVVREHVRHQ